LQVASHCNPFQSFLSSLGILLNTQAKLAIRLGVICRYPKSSNNRIPHSNIENSVRLGESHCGNWQPRPQTEDKKRNIVPELTGKGNRNALARSSGIPVPGRGYRAFYARLCPAQGSVPSRPGVKRGPTGGGLSKALYMTGCLSIVCPGRSKCRTAVLGPDGKPYRLRQGYSGTSGDGGGQWESARDCVGRLGTVKLRRF